MSDSMDPSKLKVAELRAELQSRGLDTKGNKPVLVERLKEALEAEASGQDGFNESVGRHANDAAEGEEEEEFEEEPQQEFEEEPESEPVEEPEGVEVKDEPEDSSKFGYEEAPVEEDVKTEQDNGLDVEVKEEVEVKQEVVPKEEPVESAEATEGRRRGEKRPRSRSRSPEAVPEAKKSRPEVEEVRIEDEPEIDKTVVALDWYNSDLSLVISKDDYLSAQPLTMQGFGYVWHGVRATYGFTHGRVFFEVKVEDYLPVPQLEEEEQHPHVLRAGWSINDAGLTLGEDPLSYGYGGTGKASTNLRFKDYGKQFGKGDVLGCFLDLESEPIVLSYTVNGQHQGIAYEIRHDELQGQALFPHIVTKNTSFRANFGTQEPWFQPLTGYTYVGDIPLEERVLGTQGPERREDSEMGKKMSPLKLDQMKARRETSTAQREAIITLRMANVPAREISRRLNIHKRTVYRWMKRQEETNNIENLPRRGAPRRTTREQDELIIATAKQQPSTSAFAIKHKTGLKIGIQTVRNRLHEAGIHHRIPDTEPLE